MDGEFLGDLARRAHLPDRHTLLTFADDSARVLQHLGRGRYQTRTITDKAAFAELWRDPRLGEVIVPDQDLDRLPAWLPEGDGERRVLIVDEGGSLTEGEVLATGDRARVVLHLRDQLDFDRAPGVDLGLVGDMLEAPFARSQARVVSLFDDRDVDVLSALDRAAGDTHRVMPDVSAIEMARVAEGARDRLVIVVGHVEDGAFVVRRPDGSVRSSLKVADVERALDEQGATGLFLGCQTAGIGVTGLPHCVNVLQVADGIQSIQHATTYGEVLDGIAASAGGLVVEARLVDGTLRALEARRRVDVRDRRLNQAWFAARLTASQLRTDDPALEFRARALMAGVWQAVRLGDLHGWLSVWFMSWFVGLFVGMFVLRSEWRDYWDVFPVQASWYTSSVRRLVIKTGRFAAFALFVPSLMSLQLAMLLLSGFVLLSVALEGWPGALAVALIAGLAHVVLAREERGWFRVASHEWRSAVMVGGLGLFVAAAVFDLAIGPTGLRPPGIEQAPPLGIAALLSAALVLIRWRWQLGICELPAALFYIGLFTAAAWLDRVTRPGWREAS